MGRPKLSDLVCTICDMSFKTKSTFDSHMENHLNSENQGRTPRKRSNWCHVCRKSFADSEYKLHMAEHHSDSSELVISGSNDDIFSCENGFILLSKKKIKKEIETLPKKTSTSKNNSLAVSFADIKVEPGEDIAEEFIVPENLQQSVLKAKIPKIKCSVCGLRCKGDRGLKIHMNAHKRSFNNSVHMSESEDEIDEMQQINQTGTPSGINSLTTNANPSFLLSNNGVINLGQNAQPGYFITVPQLQNQSVNSFGNPGNSVLNFGNPVGGFVNAPNQSNAQFLPVASNQTVQLVNTVPQFDPNSEKYRKWLKNFINKSKMYQFPLTPKLCQSISQVSGDIVNALYGPASFLKQKSDRDYFVKMQYVLSEIMLGHMRHSFCVVSR